MRNFRHFLAWAGVSRYTDGTRGKSVFSLHRLRTVCGRMDGGKIDCEVEQMKHIVITMAREYASGGSEIAQMVAQELGIPLYNKELITIAAKKSGLTEEAIAASETQRSGSLIYSLYMMGNTLPLADQVYILQSNVIKELAEKESCIILGRCGDYVLRDRENVLRTFVFAPLEQRIAFAKARPGAKDMADRLWEATLAKHDRARASYYNYYTENRWGEAKNYDLCLNAALGRETCAQIIVDAARAMQNQQ